MSNGISKSLQFLVGGGQLKIARSSPVLSFMISPLPACAP